AAAQETPCVEIALIVTLYFRGASPGPPWISITSVLFAHLCTGPAAAIAPGVSAATPPASAASPPSTANRLPLSRASIQASVSSGANRRRSRRRIRPCPPARNDECPAYTGSTRTPKGET